MTKSSEIAPVIIHAGGGIGLRRVDEEILQQAEAIEWCSGCNAYHLSPDHTVEDIAAVLAAAQNDPQWADAMRDAAYPNT